VPLIPIEILPSKSVQSARSPPALPERFGPHEVAIAARKSSAKLPLEQAPSVIAEPPVAVADNLSFTTTYGKIYSMGYIMYRVLSL
jgi:hypothetical protein